MTIITASAATIGNWGLAAILRAAGPAHRARQFVVFTGVACAATGRRVQRAVSLRKEAIARRLENFVLDPATHEDPEVGRSSASVWTETQGSLDGATKSFRQRSTIFVSIEEDPRRTLP
jgi:hypothetical protein